MNVENSKIAKNGWDAMSCLIRAQQSGAKFAFPWHIPFVWFHVETETRNNSIERAVDFEKWRKQIKAKYWKYCGLFSYVSKISFNVGVKKNKDFWWFACAKQSWEKNRKNIPVVEKQHTFFDDTNSQSCAVLTFMSTCSSSISLPIQLIIRFVQLV